MGGGRVQGQSVSQPAGACAAHLAWCNGTAQARHHDGRGAVTVGCASGPAASSLSEGLSGGNAMVSASGARASNSDAKRSPDAGSTARGGRLRAADRVREFSEPATGAVLLARARNGDSSSRGRFAAETAEATI